MDDRAAHPWTVEGADAWRLLIEPMSREEAAVAADAINDRLPHVHAFPVDPRRALTLTWDRAGVELFADALEAFSDDPRVFPGMVAELRAWLARAAPDDGRGGWTLFERS